MGGRAIGSGEVTSSGPVYQYFVVLLLSELALDHLLLVLLGVRFIAARAADMRWYSSSVIGDMARFWTSLADS